MIQCERTVIKSGNIYLLSCDGKKTRYPVVHLPTVYSCWVQFFKDLAHVDCCLTQRDRGNVVIAPDVTSTRIGDIIDELLMNGTIGSPDCQTRRTLRDWEVSSSSVFDVSQNFNPFGSVRITVPSLQKKEII